MTKPPHISVCICTYKRPELLRHLLRELANQITEGRFTYSIVIADNDKEKSGEPVVREFEATYDIPIRYCTEPQQNIALARNKAVANATGDFVCFIDDDEFPIQRWLLILFQAWEKYQVDGVLGPVHPHYEEGAPQWLRKGPFYDRRSYPTGTVIDWTQGRTGNTFLKRSLFEDLDQPFRPEFRAGEDQDFFRRVIEAGHKFIWCDEAKAYETVPPMRWKRSFILRRAMLRGATASLQPNCGTASLAKSVVASVLYALALPFSLLFGQHRFMTLLMKLCDHVGKLLASAGLNPVKEPYVTE